MRVLLLGANGFIGRELAAALAAHYFIRPLLRAALPFLWLASAR